MQYRKDRHGEPISILGYGCMRFSRKGASFDYEKSAKELMRAYELGVNYFDTAYVYGGSEELLGRFLDENKLRDKVNIATKLPQYLVKNAGAIDRYFNEELKRLRESERYTKGMYCWIGFKKKELLFDRGNRVAGKSAWSFRKLFGLAVDGITSFSIAPLRLTTLIGIIVSLLGFIFMCKVLIKAIFWGDPVQGYSSLMVVILFLGGIQLISLGIIGEYLGKTYMEVKKRPVYIVDTYVC